MLYSFSWMIPRRLKFEPTFRNTIPKRRSTKLHTPENHPKVRIQQKAQVQHAELSTASPLMEWLKYYLLTPWCRDLLEKLTGLQLVKKFPAFHGTQRFISELTSVRHLSLSWASPIQSIYPHSTSWRPILILSTHLRLGLPSGLFPSGFPPRPHTPPSPHPYAPHAPPISFSRFHHPHNIG